jgi:hypothetical protein
VAVNGRYAICNREPSDRQAKGNGGGWVHRLDGYSAAPDPRRPDPSRSGQSAASMAPIDRRNTAYRRLRAATTLHGRHIAELRIRGFAQSEPEARGYRTLPLEGQSRVAKRCVEDDPTQLVGVPGFWTASGSDGGGYWTLAGRPGLLIPCLDPQGRIRGYRVRVDDPPDGSGKYNWFSSGHKPGGTGSGVHCHVSRPLGRPPDDDAVWVTEGEIKADLASERLGAIVVSVPGVDLWSRCLPDLAELLPDGGDVVLAFDADWRDKPQVHEALWRLALVCQALDYGLRIALWNVSDGKGLDDLLTAGRRPELHPPSCLPAPSWKNKVSSRVLMELPAPIATAATATRTLAEIREQFPEVLGSLCRCA